MKLKETIKMLKDIYHKQGDMEVYVRSPKYSDTFIVFQDIDYCDDIVILDNTIFKEPEEDNAY